MRSKNAALIVVVLVIGVVLGILGLLGTSGADTAALAQDEAQTDQLESQFYALAGLCHVSGSGLSSDQITLNEGAILVAFGDINPDAAEVIDGKKWHGSTLMRLVLDQRIGLANSWYVEAGGSQDDCPKGAQFGYENTNGQDSSEATIESLEERIAELESQVAALTGTGGSSDLPPVNPDTDFVGRGIDESYAFDIRCGIGLPDNGFREVDNGFYLLHCERIPPFGFEDHAPKILVLDQ